MTNLFSKDRCKIARAFFLRPSSPTKRLKSTNEEKELNGCKKIEDEKRVIDIKPPISDPKNKKPVCQK